MTIKTLKIGLFGIGLETYWNQFEGLRERLEGYQLQIESKLVQNEGSTVVSVGLIDTIEKAERAADVFKTERVSIIFLYISTYALSSTVLKVVQHVNVPVVILNLQPVRAVDYDWFNSLKDRGKMTGEWLANCQAVTVPEIANVFYRSRIPFHQITGTLDDVEAWSEIHDWMAVAKVAFEMSKNRLGVLGHYYNGMLDIYSDLTLQVVKFGGHIQHLEMCDLKSFQETVTEDEIQLKTKQIFEEFEVLEECSSSEIKRAAKTAVALDKLVAHFKLGSMAYYYEGKDGNEYEDIISSVIAGNSMLTANNIPVAGEYDVKTAQAMKIMDLFGAGGSFTEFYGLDFNEDIILMGHDGPGHLTIAEGKPLLKPLGVYHGKPGKGLSVEMKVKLGPVTLLSVVETLEGNLKLLTAEGESVAGPILEIGNTNSRYKFPINVKSFINAWSQEAPAHHCAIGVGSLGNKLEKLGAILKIEVVRIC